MTLAVLTLCSANGQQQSSDGSAIVEGRVLDTQGQPVPGARISMAIFAGHSGPMPSAATDKDGHYRLVSPPYGKAWLCAVKESAGYPDINATIFVPPVPEDSRPEVDLTPSSRLHLDIQLGPPDGIFEGTVVDATTNTPIKTARITMRREDIEHGYYSTGIMGGHFLFALPSAPVEITITAPGYAPWKYKDSKSEVQNLTLSSSERRSLTIELTPIK